MQVNMELFDLCVKAGVCSPSENNHHHPVNVDRSSMLHVIRDDQGELRMWTSPFTLASGSSADIISFNEMTKTERLLLIHAKLLTFDLFTIVYRYRLHL